MTDHETRAWQRCVDIEEIYSEKDGYSVKLTVQAKGVFLTMTVGGTVNLKAEEPGEFLEFSLKPGDRKSVSLYSNSRKPCGTRTFRLGVVSD